MKQPKIKLSALLIGICLMLPALPLSAQSLSGNGDVVKQSRETPNFTGVEVGGAFDVIIKSGSATAVMVEADENLLDAIETKVSDGVLRIRLSQNVKKSKEMRVYLTMPELKSLKASGASDIIGKSRFKTKSLEIVGSGASDITLEVDCEQLDCQVSGSSDLRLSGKGQSANIRVSGSGDFKGSEFTLQSVETKVSGSGDAYVYVTEEIMAAVSGSGDVHVTGDPQVRSVSTSGSGEVHFK